MTKGIFISLEGGDGAGKSTQMNNIEKYFNERGYSCVRTREPGGTSIGEKLREILLDPENSGMESVTEMMIYAAARAQIVREFIRPALERGEVVICDRFVDSSIAYQTYGRELGDMVKIVNSYAVDGLMPDITFWMDINPEAGRERIGTREDSTLDRLEREKMDFHYRVYDGYRSLCEAEPDRVKRIDATRTIEEMKDEIYGYLDELCTRIHR
ncbi:MAG: dTMP kinase [Clostridiales bacterium]|nr:dTMP kinase [Candidatus Crickella equi]